MLFNATGGNLTVEMICKSILIAAQEKKLKKIRNVYVEMDNASPNKCFTVVAAMGALCLLGIVKKVKLSYLVVGHTHDDYDAIIGTIATYIANLDLPTFDDYKKAAKEAIHAANSTVLAVEKIVGICDYDRLFRDFNVSDVTGLFITLVYINYAMHIILLSSDIKYNIFVGLARAKSIRITAKTDGTGVNVFYKVSHRQKGWFPRPCPPGCMTLARQMFTHEDPRQGHVKTVAANAYTDNGRRQEYRYIVEYYGGDVKGVDLKCPSIPFSMSREALLERIGYITRQCWKKTYFRQKSRVLANIVRILKHRDRHRYLISSVTPSLSVLIFIM
jgi:hypothetical protein